MEPSFLTLFKKGKFSRRIPQPTEDESAEPDSQRLAQGQDQLERFAVAAIGFCLKHDGNFRRRFVREVCECNEFPLGNELRISVEPEDWADFLIEIGSRFAAVIEFELNHSLEDHQNPDFEEEFFSDGYGKQIKSRLLDSGKYAESLYLVIGSKERFQEREKPFRCVGKDWSVIHFPDDESPLLADLYETLGQFGVKAFRHRAMKITDKMNLGNSVREAAAMFRLLVDVRDSLEMEFRQKPDIDFGNDGAHFGLTIPYGDRSKDENAILGKLRTLVEPGQDIGWFGYEHGDSATTTLSVWIYGTKPQVEKVHKRLEAAKKSDETVKIGTDQPYFLSVKIPSDKSNGDKEWFISVIDRIGQAIGS